MSRWIRQNPIETVEREWNGDATCIGDITRASRFSAWRRPVRTALLLAAISMMWVCIATSAAAQGLNQPPAVNPPLFTPQRMAASVAALVALIGAVMGGLALSRSDARAGTSNGPRRAIAALVMGPIGFVVGSLIVAGADGRLGTGKGLAGGVVAMVLGLIGTALGGLALARFRRTV